ncbi:hypothetical protein ABK040_007455 [Willaertia magna]
MLLPEGPTSFVQQIIEETTQFIVQLKDPASVPFSCAMIMIGCVFNVIVLEMILNIDSNFGPLLTFIQFLFISIESFRYNFDFETFKLKERSIPLWFYGILVFLFFLQSYINNIVFGYHISMVLHTIFRSSSLLMNLIVGMFMFGFKQPLQKILSVLLITIGIFCAILASNKSEVKVFGQEVNISQWTFGLLLLTLSQFTTGLLGNLQTYGYQKFGKKDENENLFYSHALSLPLFLIFYKDLIANVETLILNPILYWYLFLSVITQIICIRGVYRLTAQTNSLTTTLTITIRKFISLIISIFYFGNTFTLLHTLGTLLVFYGTHLFVSTPKE